MGFGLSQAPRHLGRPGEARRGGKVGAGSAVVAVLVPEATAPQVTAGLEWEHAERFRER